MKRRRGLTLIELMIAMFLTALILTVGFQFMNIGFREFRTVSKEYALQNGVRSSMDAIENVIKESSTVFTVDKTSFDPERPVETMKREWNYIGLSPDGTKLINYVWISQSKDKKDKKGFHKAIDITPTGWNIKDADDQEIRYKIGFYQDENWHPMKPKEVETYRKEKKMVRVQLEGQLENTESTFRLNRDIIALNAPQILESRRKTNVDNPITALSYRSDDPTLSVEPADAAVVFVIDMSSSMDRTMDGKVTTNESEKRLTILKKSAERFVGELESAGKVDLYFVPFSAYMYGVLRDPKGGIRDIEQAYIEQYNRAFQGQYWKLPPKKYVEEIKKHSKKDAEYFISGVKTLFYQEDGKTYRRTFSDPVKNRVDELFRSIAEKQAIMNGITEINTKEQAEPMVKASRDALRDCLELMQQPYHLDYEKPQAVHAIDYIYKNLYTKPSGSDTNLGGAIREGYKLLQRSEKPLKYLVILSDGKPIQFDYQGETVGHLRYNRLTKNTLYQVMVNQDRLPAEAEKVIKWYCYIPKPEFLPDTADYSDRPKTNEEVEERVKVYAARVVTKAEKVQKMAEWDAKRAQERIAFEATLADLTEEQKKKKLEEWDGQTESLRVGFELNLIVVETDADKEEEIEAYRRSQEGLKAGYINTKKAIKKERQEKGLIDKGILKALPGDADPLFIKLEEFKDLSNKQHSTFGRTDYTFPGDSLMIQYIKERDGNNYTGKLYKDDRYTKRDDIVDLYKAWAKTKDLTVEEQKKKAEFQRLYENGLYARGYDGSAPLIFDKKEKYYPEPPRNEVPIDPKNPGETEMKYPIVRSNSWQGQSFAEGGTSGLDALGYVETVLNKSYYSKNPEFQKDGKPMIEKTFLIGFSAEQRDKEMMGRIIEASKKGGTSRVSEYMEADSATSLTDTFQKVAKDIQDGMWFFAGP